MRLLIQRATEARCRIEGEVFSENAARERSERPDRRPRRNDNQRRQNGERRQGGFRGPRKNNEEGNK